MQMAEERLRFAVGFANMDLDHLRQGDWLNLREDLHRFLLGSPIAEGSPGALPPLPVRPPFQGSVVAAPDEAPNTYPVEAFQVLQAEIRRILEDMVDQRELAAGGQGEIGTTEIHVRCCLMCFAPTGSRPPQHTLYMMGPIRDLFCFLLYGLLSREPTDRIMRCPECQTIFYRVRKQKYCSRPCVHRANVRKWRRTEPGKQYERARTRARYERHVKRVTSPKVKVGRRAPAPQ